jgi:hypothetical protein
MKNYKKKKKPDIYSRSKFFLNLRRRCQNKQIKIEERKADLIIDKILGRDKVLNRDYSVFVYNYPAPLSSSLNKGNNNINPNIKLNIQSPSENSYSLRYKKKEIENDSFANKSINKNKKVNNTYSNIKSNKKVYKNHIETEEDKLTGFRGDVNSNKNKINDKTLITGEYFNINKY